jgi:hypothetical protein
VISWILWLIPGALFAALGWFLAETVFESIVFMVGSAMVALVAYTNLESEPLRHLVVTVIVGFNGGKVAGSVIRAVRESKAGHGG